MKRLILFLCAAYFCCALAAPGMAQDKSTSTVAPAGDTSNDETKVRTTYDAAKNETTVEFRRLEIAGSKAQMVLLNVTATYPGQKLKSQPEDIILILSVISTAGYKYPDMMAMKVSADGKKLPEVLMLNLDKRPLNPGYLETIGTRLKFEIFKRLTQAKTLELQLHDLTLQLDETHIAKMREVEALLRK